MRRKDVKPIHKGAEYGRFFVGLELKKTILEVNGGVYRKVWV